MDWFVSVREEESGAHLYRGGAAPDRATVLEQVVHAGREIAHREDGSVIAVAGEVVIDGTPVDANAFGDPGVSDETLRFEIGAAFDRVRSPHRCAARDALITEWERPRNEGTAALG